MKFRAGGQNRKSDSSRCGIARALSKLGYCSRSQAIVLVREGRVQVNRKVPRDPEFPVSLSRDRIEVDGQLFKAVEKVYLMLNKPRGLVTTASDEKGRPTVFECFREAPLPFISPVGRLDQASEGLLFFTNDTQWAAGITEPESELEKRYHVQIDCLPSAEQIVSWTKGKSVDGEWLSARRVTLLRRGERNSWVEIVLTEGKNRHIRRLLEAFNISVLRLIRISIGDVSLGELPKGSFRPLTPDEIRRLSAKRNS